MLQLDVPFLNIHHIFLIFLSLRPCSPSSFVENKVNSYLDSLKVQWGLLIPV